MRIVDLTWRIAFGDDEDASVVNYTIPLSVRGEPFQAVCHKLRMDGMSGTYLDFPGHVAETDDGLHAGDCPIEDLFMVETTTLRLDRDPMERAVTADELRGLGVQVKGDALIVHALGEKRFYDYGLDDIPYFGRDAVQWIRDQGVRIFASDIYENKADLQGIFTALFADHVSCVCHPVNLGEIRRTYSRCCVIPLRMEGIVQLPCRFFVAEGAGAPPINEKDLIP